VKQTFLNFDWNVGIFLISKNSKMF